MASIATQLQEGTAPATTGLRAPSQARDDGVDGALAPGLLVADDDPFVCEGVRQLVGREGRWRVAATALTGEEIFEHLGNPAIRMLLVDVNMPGPGAIEITRRSKRQRPDVGVVIFSVRADEGYALQTIRAGADGFVAKQNAFADLNDALDTVARGERYLEPKLATRMVAQAADGRCLDFSEREMEVLKGLVGGQRITEIAASLDLSPKTVSTYRARLLRKAGLRNTAELIRFAMYTRLVS